jgi:acetyltransferase-like isoleucine patch superfamily enzyme
MDVMIKIMKKLLNYLVCKRWNISCDCFVHYSAKLKNATLEGKNKISRSVVINNSFLGYGSYLGVDSILPQCVIGRFTSISGHVRLVTGRHPTRTLVSTHPAFYSSVEIYSFKPFTYVQTSKYNEFKLIDDKHSVIIGNDVWIGYSVLLMEGITIGDGAVIGAGAVVTGDVPPYSIAVGIPAKVKRYRFSKEDIDFLLKLKWWDKEESWLRKAAPYFDAIENLKEFCKFNDA